MSYDIEEKFKGIKSLNNNNYNIKGSYKEEDCVFLLKDITSDIEEVDIKETNELIKNGIKYSEIIPSEDAVSDSYNELFIRLLKSNKRALAKYVANMGDSIYADKGKDTVIVSLARAGTPCGILVKKYIEYKYKVNIPHYSVSIIREFGLDDNAIIYILGKHPNCKIQFVDGWTGKGSITHELKKTIKDINNKYGLDLDDSLAVLADPAKISKIAGIREDVFIANSCLNSTISGLVSKTCLNDKFIGENDFHGAKVYNHLKFQDLSEYFIEEVSNEFKFVHGEIKYYKNEYYGEKVIDLISKEFNLPESKIKLSIGEGARALLRYTPKIMLVKNIKDIQIAPLLELALKQGVEIKEYDKTDYEVICLLK